MTENFIFIPKKGVKGFKITNTQIFLKNAKSFNVFHVLMLLTSCEQADHHPEDESSGFQSVLLLI